MRVRSLGVPILVCAAALLWAGTGGGRDENIDPPIDPRGRDSDLPRPVSSSNKPGEKDAAATISALFVPAVGRSSMALSSADPRVPPAASTAPRTASAAQSRPQPATSRRAPSFTHDRRREPAGTTPESAGTMAVDYEPEEALQDPLSAQRAEPVLGARASEAVVSPAPQARSAPAGLRAAVAVEPPTSTPSLQNVRLSAWTVSADPTNSGIPEPRHGSPGRLEVIGELQQPDRMVEYYLIDQTTGRLVRLTTRRTDPPAAERVDEARKEWVLHQVDDGSLVVDHVSDEGWVRYTVPHETGSGL